MKLETDLKTDEEKLSQKVGDLSVDDLKDSSSSNGNTPQSKTPSNGTPSEAGTYTLRWENLVITPENHSFSSQEFHQFHISHGINLG